MQRIKEVHARLQWQDAVSTVPLSLRNWERSYMDDLANRVKLAKDYSTPLLHKCQKPSRYWRGRITLDFLV